ncbi:hypothetical protein AB0G35_11910 [Streptomyces sp. NPDC021749]
MRAPLYAETRIALPFDQVWAVIADYRRLLGKRRTRAFFRAVEHRAALR